MMTMRGKYKSTNNGKCNRPKGYFYINHLRESKFARNCKDF